MNRLFEALRPFIRGVVRRAGWVLLAALILSAASLYVARDLRISTDFSQLLPPDNPTVQALERLRATVGGESGVAVAIQSPSFEANVAFAEALIPEALQLTGERREEPFLVRAEFRRNADFLKENALYFATEAELDTLETYLREQIREAKLEANPFYFDLNVGGQEEAETDSTAQRLEQIYESLTVSQYMLSPDSTVLVVRFYPAGAQTDIGFIEQTYDALDRLVARMNPESFHPQMEITLGGRLYRQLVEIRTIRSDVIGSFGAGVAAVLLFVVLYFFYKAYRARAGGRFDRRILLQELARTPVMALLIGAPLLMSLTWTAAVAELAFDTLNLFTSTLGLVLFGLGIDFGIHFYARYAEERADGRSIRAAAEHTFTTTGQAIALTALTTAAGLFALTIAEFRGFSQFGFVAGCGLLLALVAMVVVLPALLTFFERLGLLSLQAREHAAGRGTEATARRFPAARLLAAGGVVVVVVALALLPSLSFQYDFSELEPEYTGYEEREAVIERTEPPDAGNLRNPAYVVTGDPSEVPAIVEAVREHMAQDTTSPTIAKVVSLQMRYPLREEAQQQKLARIAEIRGLLSSKYLEADTSEALQRLRRAAGTRAPIPLARVPDYMKKRFMTKSGEVGGFAMIYPSVGLSHGKKSIAFSEDVGTIVTDEGKTYYAASTPLVAADMLQLLLSEAPYMIALTFLMVSLLMYLDFRSIRWTLLALVPLAVGMLWMLLILALTGLQLNFYNIIVLPALLGIGDDAGVHLVHRYREEGFGSIRRVLRSTGEHVTMGALTTMIGFAGLLLSFHPGLRSIGLLAVVGIGTTLLAALVFLPALLQWLEDRGQTPPDLAADGRGAYREERTAIAE